MKKRFLSELRELLDEKTWSADVVKLIDAMIPLENTIAYRKADELDEMERVLSAFIRVLRKETYHKSRWIVKDAWDDAGPRSDRASILENPGLLERRDGGAKAYLSEPFRLDSDDLMELAKLIRSGWSVSIRPILSTRFPGRSMAVLFTEGRI